MFNVAYMQNSEEKVESFETAEERTAALKNIRRRKTVEVATINTWEGEPEVEEPEVEAPEVEEPEVEEPKPIEPVSDTAEEQPALFDLTAPTDSPVQAEPVKVEGATKSGNKRKLVPITPAQYEELKKLNQDGAKAKLYTAAGRVKAYKGAGNLWYQIFIDMLSAMELVESIHFSVDYNRNPDDPYAMIILYVSE